MVEWVYENDNRGMGRAEKLLAGRLGRKGKGKQSDLPDPEGRQCGGTATGRTAAFWRGAVVKGDKRRGQRRRNIRHIQRCFISSRAKERGMAEMDV